MFPCKTALIYLKMGASQVTQQQLPGIIKMPTLTVKHQKEQKHLKIQIEQWRESWGG